MEPNRQHRIAAERPELQTSMGTRMLGTISCINYTKCEIPKYCHRLATCLKTLLDWQWVSSANS